MKMHNILVFANLKESQIFYKIIPLSKSKYVNKIVILRKNFINLNNDKIICLSIPKFFQIRPFYWFFVPIYGIYLIRKNDISILLSYNIFPHGFNAWFASKVRRRPVIFCEINEETMIYHSKKFIKPLIRKIIFNALHITVTGSNNQLFWEKNGAKNIHRLHSTINVDVFKPDYTVKKELDFVYIGEFDKNKRPDLILMAFVQIRKLGRDAKLCMIGFGELSDRLSEIIKENALQNDVRIVSTHSVLEYLQKSRVFIMASLSEGLPCALMESMACEVIPLVPKVGDIGDVVINNENGFIFDGTQKDLVKKMLFVLDNYPNLNEMRIMARKKIVNEHSYEVAVNKWDSLFGKISI